MLKRRFSRLALWLSLTLVTQSLVLDTPSPADGFNALVTNGTATVSWTSQSGDPERMSIEIQNIVTLDSFEFARNVAVSDGTASGVLDGVPGSPHYYLQAVMTGNSNIFQVLANSSTFTVNGLVPSTTDSALVPHTSTTSTTSSTSSATSSATPSSVEASGVNSNTSGSGSPIGTIVGGTLGGVAGVILLVLLGLLLFQRHKRKTEKFLVEPLTDNYRDETSDLSASVPFDLKNSSSHSTTRPPTTETTPTPYPLTIPSPYPYTGTTSSGSPKQSKSQTGETFAQEQRERKQKLDVVTNRQAKMKQQWAELRSQNGDLSSSSPTSPMMNPTLPRPTLRTEPLMGEIDAGSEAVIIPDGSSPLSHLPDSAGGDTNTNTQTSLPTPADSNGNTLPAALDPEIQRRLNEMSQRIEELEVEKEELTRELKDAVPPPGYAE